MLIPVLFGALLSLTGAEIDSAAIHLPSSDLPTDTSTKTPEIHKPKLAVQVKEAPPGVRVASSEGTIELGLDVLLSGGILFNGELILIRPTSGLSFGFNAYLGKLDSKADSALVCDQYGFGPNCEYRKYVKQVYGFDLLAGYHKYLNSTKQFQFQCMIGPSFGFTSEEIPSCSITGGCSKPSETGVGLTIQPEIQVYFGGSLFIAASSRIDLAGVNPGASIGARTGIYLK